MEISPSQDCRGENDRTTGKGDGEKYVRPLYPLHIITCASVSHKYMQVLWFKSLLGWQINLTKFLTGFPASSHMACGAIVPEVWVTENYCVFSCSVSKVNFSLQMSRLLGCHESRSLQKFIIKHKTEWNNNRYLYTNMEAVWEVVSDGPSEATLFSFWRFDLNSFNLFKRPACESVPERKPETLSTGRKMIFGEMNLK